MAYDPKAYNREYYARNRERLREKNRQQNNERHLAQKRERHAQLVALEKTAQAQEKPRIPAPAEPEPDPNPADSVLMRRYWNGDELVYEFRGEQGGRMLMNLLARRDIMHGL